MASKACVGLAVVITLLSTAWSAQADPAGRITGVGGIFFKSRDPKALIAWYREVLGLHVETWGGALLSTTAPGHPPLVVWCPFPMSTSEIAPSNREFMVNFAVDDLDAYVARLTSKGVKIISRDTDANGSVADILDPDGTKIEFWQPKKK